MEAKDSIDNGPAIHPSCAKLHAKDSTPDPITPVIICATAVHTFPSRKKHMRKVGQIYCSRQRPFWDHCSILLWVFISRNFICW